LGRAIQTLSRLDAQADLLPNRDLFIYMFVRKEALVSSQIEGTQSSLSDLLLYEEKQTPVTPVEDVEEVCNYIAALNYSIDAMQNKLPLSARLLRECHKILLNGVRGKDKNPGQFRKSQNWIGGIRPGRAVYVPPPQEYVSELISDLEKFIHAPDTNIPALLKAALAHVQFETIHPFLDGNGRVGRLLIILMLIQEGLINAPVVYLSLFFKEHRQLYYDHLQAIRLKGDWESWCLFFLDGIITSGQAAEHEITRITALIKQDTEKIETLGRARINAHKVFDHLLHHPLTTIASISKATGLSVPAATNNIQHLQNIGVLRETTGQGKNRIYEYEAYMRILGKDMDPI
jgi:Fic family protein